MCKSTAKTISVALEFCGEKRTNKITENYFAYFNSQICCFTENDTMAHKEVLKIMENLVYDSACPAITANALLTLTYRLN